MTTKLNQQNNRQKQKTIIGIIGGMGPSAGLDLATKIHINTIANGDVDHISTILLSFPSEIPDRTEYILGKITENPADSIINLLSKLVNLGADVAGIPCSTSHSHKIIDPVKRHINQHNLPITLVNMVDETTRYIKKQYPNVKKIGILASNGTVLSKVYSSYLERLNIVAIYPTYRDQECLVHQSIYNKKYGIKSNSDGQHVTAKENLNLAARNLIELGADVIILGCTEIPLAVKDKFIDGKPVIDPTSVLARVLVHLCDPKKLTK